MNVTRATRAKLIDDVVRERKRIKTRIEELQERRALALNANQDDEAKDLQDQIDILVMDYNECTKQVQALESEDDEVAGAVLRTRTGVSGRRKLLVAKADLDRVEKALVQVRKQLATIEMAFQDIMQQAGSGSDNGDQGIHR